MKPIDIESTYKVSEPSDVQIVNEVVLGNREMFEVLVRRYNTRLYRIGLSYLRRHDQVEDAMQNTYLKAYLKLGGFNQQAAFSTWLTRIMINECLMTLRRQRETTVVFDEETATRTTSKSQAASALTLTEMKNLLEKAISELPQNLRTVYVMREVEQLTTEETAISLGATIGSVKVSLHRARERLKTTLLNQAAGLELFPYHAEYCDPMTERVMHAILRIS